ncbi:porin [Vibrio sp.]|nr:porin [Vibrio sp.]
MENVFKRTLLGAAVALAATGANAAIQLAGENVELYGVAAGYNMTTSYAADGADTTNHSLIETKFGFKGRHQYDDFGPDIIWQVETGYASHQDHSWGAFNGLVGGRDTWVGLDWTNVGSLKVGRQLVAAYNYVDWPHSNPGLGNVFDWNNDIGAPFQDRADNVVRFDSANFGGFNFQASASGMEASTDEMVLSLAGSFQLGPVNLHAGHYSRDEAADGSFEDHSYTIVGASAGLGKLTLTGAVKAMEHGSQEQNAYSATAQLLLTDKLLVKAGYALTEEVDSNDDGDVAMTVRLGYLLPSAYLYADVRDYDFNGDDESADQTRLLLGMEYYF